MTRICAWTAVAALVLAVGGVGAADDKGPCPTDETLIGTALGLLSAPPGCCTGCAAMGCPNCCADQQADCCPKCCKDQQADCCPKCCKDKGQDCCKGKGKKCCAKCCEKRACCAETCPKAQKEKQIEQCLNKPTSCDFKDTPLSVAIDDFCKQTGLNFVVDRAALADAGIADRTPVVTLAVHDVSVKTALKLALQQAHLTYVLNNEVVLVTTEANARGSMVRRLFPVEGLLPQSNKKLENVLIDLITQAITPESWSKVGGKGTIAYFPPGKALVVNQTADVQEQIAELLASLGRLIESQPVASAAPWAPGMALLSCREFPLPPPPMPPPLFANGPPSFHGNPFWAAPPCLVPPAAPEPFRPGFTPDRFVSAPLGGNYYYSVVPAAATQYANPVAYQHLFPPSPGAEFPTADVTPSGYYPPPPVLSNPLGIQPCSAESPAAPACAGPCCPAPCVPAAARGSSCCKGCVLQAAGGKDQGRIEILSGCTTRLTCENLVLSVPYCEPVKVTVADKQVRVSGAFFRATADRVIRTSRDDGLVLDGHVKLKYHKDNQRADVAADHVKVGLAAGHVEISPVSPDTKAKASASCPAAVLIRTKTAEGKDILSFWPGFFH